MKSNTNIEIFRKGFGKPILLLVYCMHGDEVIGKLIADQITTLDIKKGTLICLLANPKAYKHQKRFIKKDLNRVFPGKTIGIYEEALANKITKVVRSVDYVVDIHSTTGKSEPFAIVINDNARTIKLIKSTGIGNVVLMGKNLASGKSLINQTKNGFSVEYYAKAPKKSLKIGTENIKALFVELGMVKGEKQKSKTSKFYKVVSVLARPEKFIAKVKFENLGLIKKGTLLGFSKNEPIVADKDFYPIFYGEKAYKDLLFLQAIKIRKS